MSERISPVWLTKRLAEGLRKEESGETNAEFPGMLCLSTGNWHDYYHGEGRQWHRTEASARERLEKMRLAKIASLEKQAAKLRKISFKEN